MTTTKPLPSPWPPTSPSRSALPKEFETLESAIASRTVIGQAEGMLMHRYALSPYQAFAMLARESQASHRKLRDIAADIVRNGTKSSYLK